MGYKSPIDKDNGNAVGHGHFYCEYDPATGLPSRLSTVRELKIVKTGRNPEIWDSKTQKFIDTKGV